MTHNKNRRNVPTEQQPIKHNSKKSQKHPTQEPLPQPKDYEEIEY